MKLFKSTGSYRSISSDNELSAYSSPLAFFKSPIFSRCLIYGIVSAAMLLGACTEINTDPVDQDVLNAVESQTSSLTLVPPQSDLIEIKAKLSNGVDINSKATKAGGDDRGRFNITLKYVTPVTERQDQVFQNAAARWERIIIKDVPSIDGPIPSAFVGLADIEGIIDDIIIEVAIAPIDGPGNILGQAGPRFIRLSDYLTLSGVMFFDVEDLEELETFGLFEDVIVHEMGHVLGIGTLWNTPNRTLSIGPVSNPYFAGKMANTHWKSEGGKNFLPIENIGGSGTALFHWREAVLGNELMTGFLNLGENPLSRITAGSVRDLGYGAAMVGEKYDLPNFTSADWSDIH